jgi:hypothetical protein
MTLKTLCLTTVLLSAAAAPAMAHHSFAMFANDKTVTIKGTVKALEWINPHSWLHVVAMGTAGAPEEWAFEMGSPGMMATRGWKKDTLKVGDKITVVAHPMRDPEAHGGSEMSVTLPSGAVLGSSKPGKKGAGPYY